MTRELRKRVNGKAVTEKDKRPVQAPVAPKPARAITTKKTRKRKSPTPAEGASKSKRAKVGRSNAADAADSAPRVSTSPQPRRKVKLRIKGPKKGGPDGEAYDDDWDDNDNMDVEFDVLAAEPNEFMASCDWLYNFRIPNWAPDKHGRARRAFDSREEVEDYLEQNCIEPADAWDLTDATFQSSGWISFKNRDRATVFLDGLIGCSIIAAFSKEGMIVFHIWEDNGNNGKCKDKVVRHYTGNCVSGSRGEHPIRRYLAKFEAELKAHQDKLKGGKLMVAIPLWGKPILDADGEPKKDANGHWIQDGWWHRYKYDIQEWSRLTRDGVRLEPTKSRKAVILRVVPKMIKATARNGSGFKTITKEVKYRPNWFEEMDKDRPIHQTFAILYQSDFKVKKKKKGVKRVQAWCNGETVFDQEKGPHKPLIW